MAANAKPAFEAARSRRAILPGLRPKHYVESAEARIILNAADLTNLPPLHRKQVTGGLTDEFRILTCSE
jgi:hypothetical protein